MKMCRYAFECLWKWMKKIESTPSHVKWISHVSVNGWFVCLVLNFQTRHCQWIKESHSKLSQIVFFLVYKRRCSITSKWEGDREKNHKKKSLYKRHRFISSLLLSQRLESSIVLLHKFIPFAGSQIITKVCRITNQNTGLQIFFEF